MKLTSFFVTGTGQTCVAAVLAGTFATPALADVTAEDVWQNVQAPILALGGRIEAETTRNSNQLEIGDTVISFDLPMGLGALNITASGYTLAENGDGTVSLLYPQGMTAAIEARDDDGVLLSAEVQLEDLVQTVTASGDPGDVAYDYKLDKGTFRMDGMTVRDQPDADMSINGMMEGTHGTYRITEGDITRIVVETENGLMSFNSRMVEPLDPAVGDGQTIVTEDSQTTEGGTTKAVLEIPTGKVSLMNLSQALRDGFRMDLEANGMTLNSTSDMTMGGEPLVKQAISYVIREVSYRVDADGLTAAGVNEDLKVAFETDPDLMPPMSGVAEKAVGEITMPLNTTDGAVPASMMMELANVTLDDGVWGLFDPSGALPRDPAQLVLDLEGQVENKMDLLDVAAWMGFAGGDWPVLPHGVTLNSLVLDAAGAKVAGTGEFTFDTTDLETFDGFPAPDGALDLEISGANGLIDKLIEGGILPEDQAMGARMMMGMFTVPGDGEDTLTSRIEVKPDGQVLANGQRLR